ncbi:hypothetical protein [Nesterenkonia pannonica]|uniref:hypothetical protein n=1 Tax=Nesterenkonia pannonica TaxID=1548602 RepID=UPI002164CD80|nr:hypothetical protein [Nesterenkonia pannonica]
MGRRLPRRDCAAADRLCRADRWGAPHWFGLGEEDAINIRSVALLAAAWHLIFALPLLLTKIPTADQDHVEEKVTVAESYRRLFRVLAGLWRHDRNTLWFLLSSAIYRDGLSAIFTWGAVLGVHVYQIEDADIPFTQIVSSVLLFGIAGNVVAALGAFSQAAGSMTGSARAV